MKNEDLPFADQTLNAEERLQSLFAFSRGAAAAVMDICRRAEAYQALLDEELAGQPAPAAYLRESRDAIGKACEWLGTLLETVDCRLDFEPLDLVVLAAGVAKRGKRLPAAAGLQMLNPDAAELVVEGSLFQLQEMLVRLLRQTLASQAMPPPYTIALRAGAFDRNFFVLRQSRCVAGNYGVVTLEPVATTPDPKAAWIPLLRGAEKLDPELALAAGIAAGHGGDIFCQRLPGGCLALQVFLPLAASRQDMQAPHNLDDASLRGSETILLVDDEDMIWDVIIDMLQELGYTVILAADGRDAVDIYRANRGEIDLVILDMVMPRMDGHQAFFELKKIDPQVAVLLSSGYVSETDAQDVLDAGAAGFLQKPYKITELAKKIRGIMDARRRATKNTPG